MCVCVCGLPALSEVYPQLLPFELYIAHSGVLLENRHSHFYLDFFYAASVTLWLVCVCVLASSEQMDEGLAGRQRQYETLIHNLSKELSQCKAANQELLNHCKPANQELSMRPREPCGPIGQHGEPPRGQTQQAALQCSILFTVFTVLFCWLWRSLLVYLAAVCIQSSGRPASVFKCVNNQRTPGIYRPFLGIVTCL